MTKKALQRAPHEPGEAFQWRSVVKHDCAIAIGAVASLRIMDTIWPAEPLSWPFYVAAFVIAAAVAAVT
jgi:hypothetical protein